MLFLNVFKTWFSCEVFVIILINPNLICSHILNTEQVIGRRISRCKHYDVSFFLLRIFPTILIQCFGFWANQIYTVFRCYKMSYKPGGVGDLQRQHKCHHMSRIFNIDAAQHVADVLEECNFRVSLVDFISTKHLCLAPQRNWPSEVTLCLVGRSWCVFLIIRFEVSHTIDCRETRRRWSKRWSHHLLVNIKMGKHSVAKESPWCNGKITHLNVYVCGGG